MDEHSTELFHVRFNEHGKRFIRRFAAISYTMMVLVFFECSISIYWSIKMLSMRTQVSESFKTTLYDTIYPYLSILLAVAAIISNFFYLRFPQMLLRSIKNNDERGANQSFNLLLKGAVIFLIYLILLSADMIWALLTRNVY